jgi:hypothetical protein
MDRRNFLRTLVGGIAAGAAVRTFPFRVFSFPTEIKRWWWTTPNITCDYACTSVAIQALELENIHEQIPDLILSENIFYEKLRRNGRMGDKLWTGADFSAR